MRFLKSVTNVLSPKLVWIRITSSKWTLAFFCTVVIHCLLQLALEGFAYANNYKAITFMERIINAANPNTTRLGVATFRNGDLIVCGGSPWGSDCEVVWSVPSQQAVQAAQGTYTAPTPEPPVTFSSATLLPPTNAPRPADSATATVIAPDSSSTDVPLDTGDLASSVADNISQSPQVPSTSPKAESEDDLLKREIVPLVDEGAYVGVLITDEGLANKTVLAGNSCVSSLQVPLQNLMNSRRVDLTFMIFQVWVLGMSVVALLNESVPHIIAAFVTHIVATLWSAYQVHQSYVFRQEFNVLVVRGPCKINILPNYWGPRAQSELAVLIINIVVTLAVGAQSYKLLKNFGWQTFKKIGASLAINRCYQLVLAFSIVIQLAVFFVGANIALWLDQLCNGAVSSFSTHRKLYEGIYISTAVILVPWLAVGWLAVRSEQRVLMGIFLGIAAVMITGWASMFASRSFLFTFNSWDFFAWMTCAAAVLLVATIVLGIVCRLNFGKGLPEYLVREQFNAEPEWEPAMEKGYGDEEKVVQFPSEQGAQPIPTFSEAFVGPEGLDRLRAMSKPAARRGPGIGMHAREPSADVLAGLTEVDITGAANVTLNRSASVNSQSTLSSVSTAPGGQPVMRPTDSRYNLTRINTSESYRSTSTAATADRMNRNRRVIE